MNTDVTVITFIDINKPIGLNTGTLLSSASLFTNANGTMLLLIKAVTQVSWQVGHNIQRATWLPLRFNATSIQPLFHPGSAADTSCWPSLFSGTLLSAALAESIRELENVDEGLLPTRSIYSPITDPNSERGSRSIMPAEWQTWLIQCG